jgi:serine/threonine protein kinase
MELAGRRECLRKRKNRCWQGGQSQRQSLVPRNSTMPLSVSRFLDTIERSGLVDKPQLDRSLAELERESGAEAANDSLIVSAHLGRTGLITPWQTRRLLEGRHAGYFLGKYKLLDHLGTGGMSNVFLAEHPLMRRRVAIKVLPKDRVNDSSYLARFHREARAVASLDHPNIMRAFDVDNEGDVHYLVMEFIEGQDLRTLVERQGPLPYRAAADYIRQAADGLAHAHQAGLIHRDVKPANLLVDNKQVVKVLDMGLARTSDDIDASLTKDHDERMLGTVDYLAPEQALDSHLVDPRADVYSLGCTLYFALTGRPPFPEGTLAQRVLKHQTQQPEPIVAKRPDVPPALEAICRRMMAKSAAARYQTAAEVSAALADWIKRYDAGETGTATVRPEADEELTLAPLDDEPRAAAPAPKPRVDSASESSRSGKGDTTTVQRRETPAPKTSPTGQTTPPGNAGSSIKAAGCPSTAGGSRIVDQGRRRKSGRAVGGTRKPAARPGSRRHVAAGQCRGDAGSFLRSIAGRRFIRQPAIRPRFDVAAGWLSAQLAGRCAFDRSGRQGQAKEPLGIALVLDSGWHAPGQRAGPRHRSLEDAGVISMENRITSRSARRNVGRPSRPSNHAPRPETA